MFCGTVFYYSFDSLCLSPSFIQRDQETSVTIKGCTSFFVIDCNALGSFVLVFHDDMTCTYISLTIEEEFSLHTVIHASSSFAIQIVVVGVDW